MYRESFLISQDFVNLGRQPAQGDGRSPAHRKRTAERIGVVNVGCGDQRKRIARDYENNKHLNKSQNH